MFTCFIWASGVPFLGTFYFCLSFAPVETSICTKPGKIDLQFQNSFVEYTYKVQYITEYKYAIIVLHFLWEHYSNH